MTENLPAPQEVSLVPQMAPQNNGMLAVTAGREAQMVQMSMLAAKRFPRDELQAVARIKRACQRPRLAEAASYSYKKGDSVITGPSIRLAECISQNWGNVDISWFEVARHPAQFGNPGSSTVMAMAMDLETNTRKSIVFEVNHWRDTKLGGYAINDERDIYELLANQAQRRVRACILAVVPGDVVDEAIEECEKTIARGNSGKSLADQIRDMSVAFQNNFGVTREMLETRLMHKLESTNDTELRTLRKVYTSLKDGIATTLEQFPPAEKKDSAGGPAARKRAAAPAAPTTSNPAATTTVKTEASPGPVGTPPPPPTESPVPVKQTTVVEDLRARLKADGLADAEAEVIAILHSSVLPEGSDYQSLEEIEADSPEAILRCLRDYEGVRRAVRHARAHPPQPDLPA